MDDALIYVGRKLIRRMVGIGTEALSANGLLPNGERVVFGENTTIYL